MKKLFMVLFLLVFAYFPLVGCTPEVPCIGSGIVNGGFETCDLTGWTVSSSGSFPQVQNIQTYSGTCAAYMGDGDGGLNSGVDASIQQIVNIPSCATSASLELNYRVIGTDGDGEGYDWMKVSIDGTEILYVWSDTGGWKQLNYDLSAHIGSSIVLKISAWTQDSLSSVGYYVDNLSISWN